MSLYERCNECKGVGYHPCNSCRCSQCNAKGQVEVKCTKCDGGRVPCPQCQTSGRVVVKKTWFSEKYGPCPRCGGSGKSSCTNCRSGLVQTKCDACNGTGSRADCKVCAGMHRIVCPHCNGKGRLEGEWLRSLRELSPERLRYEYDKRRASIADLRSQLSQLHNENEAWKEQYEQEKAEAERRNALRSFFEQGDSNAGIWEDIGRVQDKMNQVNEEIEAIDRVLTEKLK